MVRIGVLAHVERGQVQAEGRQGPHRALQAAAGDQGAAVLDERVAHQPQLREQLTAAHVVAPLLVRAAGREPTASVHELLLDAGELQPVRLLGVQSQEARLHLGQQLQVACERFAQLRSGAGDPL